MATTVTRSKKASTKTRKAPAKKAAPRKKINLGKRQGPRSEEWKEASRFGHESNRLVDEYLAVLKQPKPRMPSQKTVERIAAEMPKARGVQLVILMQQEKDARAALEHATKGKERLAAAEAGFVTVAKRFSEKKKITYDTWRDFGVPAPVLKKAGIARTRIG